MEQRILILFSGIIAVTLFDAVGSVASRKMKLNINFLSLVSFLIYIGVGYWSGLWFDKITGITMTALVGLYDAVIGWKIFVALKADFGEYGEILEEEIGAGELGALTVISLTVVSALIGWFGAFLSGVILF